MATGSPLMVQYAAKELQTYLKKATGIELAIEEVMTDSKPEMDKGRQYIFVGESPYTKQIGLDVSKLKPDGFLIVVKNNYAALLGRDYRGKPISTIGWGIGHKECIFYNKETGLDTYGETGTLYAVYEFLRRHAGIRWYMPGDLGEVVPKADKLSVPAESLTMGPDYEYRNLYAGAFQKDQELALWFRRAGFGASAPVDINHSWWRWFGANKPYSGRLPECAAILDGKPFLRQSNPHDGKCGPNLCLSNPLPLQIYIDEARRFFAASTENRIFPVMPDDVLYRVCECEKCRAIWEKDMDNVSDGKYSNYVWGFAKKVADAVRAEYPDRFIACCAYEKYRMPPSSIAKLPANVAVMICKRRNLYADENERRKMDDFIATWRRSTSGPIYIWEYYNWYVHPPLRMTSPIAGLPVSFVKRIAEDLRALKGVSAGEFIEAETWGNPQVAKEREGFYNLKGLTHLQFYVTGRLLWDANQDLNALLTDYYQNFYGSAAKPMRRFFERAEELWSTFSGGKSKNLFEVYTGAVVTEMSGYLQEAIRQTDDPRCQERIRLIAGEFDALVKSRQLAAKTALLEVPQAGESITVDGRLDEKAWSRSGAFKMVDNSSGAMPACATSGLALWNGNDLYLAFICDEPDMASFKETVSIHDSDKMWGTDDTMEIFLTSSNGYVNTTGQIMINTAGVVWDAKRIPENGGTRADLSWESGTIAAVTKEKNRWIMEVKIPGACLGLDGLSGQALKADFFRVRAQRKGNTTRAEASYSAWSPTYVPQFLVEDRMGILKLVSMRPAVGSGQKLFTPIAEENFEAGRIRVGSPKIITETVSPVSTETTRKGVYAANSNKIYTSAFALLPEPYRMQIPQEKDQWLRVAYELHALENLDDSKKQPFCAAVLSIAPEAEIQAKRYNPYEETVALSLYVASVPKEGVLQIQLCQKFGGMKNRGELIYQATCPPASLPLGIEVLVSRTGYAVNFSRPVTTVKGNATGEQGFADAVAALSEPKLMTALSLVNYAENSPSQMTIDNFSASIVRQATAP